MVGFFQPGTDQAPFIDVNYQNMEQCDTVRTELLEKFPSAKIWCTATYKPDSAPKRKRTVRRTRTARR